MAKSFSPAFEIIYELALPDWAPQEVTPFHGFAPRLLSGAPFRMSGDTRGLAQWKQALRTIYVWADVKRQDERLAVIRARARAD